MSTRSLINSTIAATATAAAAAAALTLAGCSSSGPSPAHTSSMAGMSGAMSGSTSMTGRAVRAGAPASGLHNAADVVFATDMIPHHAQALEMAKLALTQAVDPEVRQLAQRIESEQTPEISAMAGWLTGWNEPVPDTSAGGMRMGGASMPGMMSDADMARLDAATGPTFDRLFLTQMITHHTGALTMAGTELRDGHNATAKALARSITAGQGDEIIRMRALLATGK